MNMIVKIAALIGIAGALGGCAAGKMLMAGYTPPMTIADLLREQEAAQTQNMPSGFEENSGSKSISLSKYKGALAESNTGSAMTASPEGAYVQPWARPKTMFNPSFSHKSLSDYAGQLSMELLKNSSGMYREDLIGIASFVALDSSLQNTSVLGNQLAEYFIAEIQQLGLSVVDFKMTNAVSITSRGDFIFSRDSMKLAKNMRMDHMLSGTLIQKAQGVQINARIMSLRNNRVVATASIIVPHYITDSLSQQYISSVNH